MACAAALRWRAALIASHSTPVWFRKSLSSEAITARFKLFEMLAYGTQLCDQCHWPCSALCSISERCTVVDVGSITAILAMRSIKNSCSAKTASTIHPRTRSMRFTILPRINDSAQLRQHRGGIRRYATPQGKSSGCLLYQQYPIADPTYLRKEQYTVQPLYLLS